ncbi:hypothetical protein SMD11_0563 [Streptomyces albireticuli]|uniref:Response regulatory domain-containing protein n=1 Tax=Streptomyces albireticuli TaxID=1940 RepID=A0A1Z2KW22_9ACTN|nr:hypothetical protein SMD11_0563 [Streptomyces albireticuli]
MPLRLVVVDDEALMRSGLRMILSAAPGIEVVAACDGPEAVAAVVRHRPDIVLLDIRMPGGHRHDGRGRRRMTHAAVPGPAEPDRRVVSDVVSAIR